jgi:cytochrome d ubiquinol oxidase subunit II
VPVGNAEGDLVTSWLNATSALIGVLAVATAAYLAAVYLAADAVRMGESELARAFRARALASGVVAGAVALAGPFVLHEDARPIWDGLTNGAGLAAMLTSFAAGITTLVLVWRWRFEPARFSAAVAVAAVVAGWPIAQSPDFLPGLTLDQAAAGDSTIVALLISVAAGAVVLVPSLALLFRLFLRGYFDVGAERPREGEERQRAQATRSRLLAPIAIGALVVGGVMTPVFDGGWKLAVGVIALLTFVATGFAYLASRVADEEQPAGGPNRT